MIDEKKLIEELRKSNLHHASNSREEVLLDRTIRIVKEQSKVGEWIPVEERLPEEGEWVLCQCKANTKEVLRIEKNGDWYHDHNHCYLSSFVDAWMPLPEPYKGELMRNE